MRSVRQTVSPRILFCFILIRVCTGYEGSAISLSFFLSPIGWGMCKQLESKQAPHGRLYMMHACNVGRHGVCHMPPLFSGRVHRLCRSIVIYLDRVACEGWDGYGTGVER